MTWTWRYENSSGTPVEPAASAPETEPFPSQADAESWIGENWRELLAGGVAQVSLFEGDRKVYGPMGLDAPG
ncbi:MAG: hypothetical protein WD794_00980 [Mycobacteriales bacterium]